ncbi:pre-mRNA 3'-end-processing factor FIP1 [Colossoma macropomum]|uniref:pre-mRNA 3'-end-processing factor FIP1 n=1 Tax=Colossoma macropomum TaxID=42526 RepID=UPI0018641631|nr:pre-mRNA 3'-end-processing factor FIP1 [Colossoma macropomum]
MSTEGTENAGCASGDDEEWLYGENDEDDAIPVDDDEKTETEVFSALIGDVEGVNGVGKQSDSDSDDDVCVTIGDIKTGGSQTITPVNIIIKTSDRASLSGTKVRGVDLDAEDSVSGTLLDADVESFEEKPWRKPGADLSDYFNYGFNEDTWKMYCDKQRRLRMSIEVMTLGSSSKVVVNRGDLSSKSDYSCRKSNSSISVIGGQTGTISRVEGRRRHTSDESNTQVQPSSEQSSDAELQPPKLHPFFPPNIPPPPFPPLSISTTSPLIPPPPRLPMTVPPPGFPVPPGVPSPPPMLTSLDSARSRGSHSAPLYPFSAGVYPPLVRAVASWPGMLDSAKAWEYYTRHDKKREREKEREKTRDRDRDRERERDRQREREHTPSFQSRSSDEECALRHRDHTDRERERQQERAGGTGEREDRYRERRHRERSERHKSSRSSYSRRRHASDDGESHRRHRHKRSRRNRDSTEPSEERSAEHDNQSEPTE